MQTSIQGTERARHGQVASHSSRFVHRGALHATNDRQLTFSCGDVERLRQLHHRASHFAIAAGRGARRQRRRDSVGAAGLTVRRAFAPHDNARRACPTPLAARTIGGPGPVQSRASAHTPTSRPAPITGPRDDPVSPNPSLSGRDEAAYNLVGRWRPSSESPGNTSPMFDDAAVVSELEDVAARLRAISATLNMHWRPRTDRGDGRFRVTRVCACIWAITEVSRKPACRQPALGLCWM